MINVQQFHATYHTFLNLDSIFDSSKFLSIDLIFESLKYLNLDFLKIDLEIQYFLKSVILTLNPNSWISIVPGLTVTEVTQRWKPSMAAAARPSSPIQLNSRISLQPHHRSSSSREEERNLWLTQLSLPPRQRRLTTAMPPLLTDRLRWSRSSKVVFAREFSGAW